MSAFSPCWRPQLLLLLLLLVRTGTAESPSEALIVIGEANTLDLIPPIAAADAGGGAASAAATAPRVRVLGDLELVGGTLLLDGTNISAIKAALHSLQETVASLQLQLATVQQQLSACTPTAASGSHTTATTTTIAAATTTTIPTTTTATLPSPEGHLDWTRLLGGPSGGFGNGVAADSAGDVFVVGSSASTLVDGQASAGSYDILLYKLASNGTRLWTRLLGSFGDEMGEGVATDRSGHVYVTGSTNYAALDGQVSAGGNSDMVLAKYAGNGTRLWTRLLGGTGAEAGAAVATDAAGNVFMVGYTDSSMLAGQPNAGQNDLVLAKYAGDGTLVWTRLLGSTANEGGTDVATDAAGNVFVCGSTTNASLDGQAGHGGSEMLLAKFSSNGTRLWTRLLGSDMDEGGSGVATDVAGNVYLTGAAPSAVLDSQAGAGRGDMALVKYAADGSRLWTRLLGGSGAEASAGVATDAAGFVYVTGQVSGDATVQGQVSGGWSDLLLAKVAPDGTWLWTRLLGEGSYEVSNSVATNPATGQVCVTGWTNAQSLNEASNPAGNNFLVACYS